MSFWLANVPPSTTVPLVGALAVVKSPHHILRNSYASGASKFELRSRWDGFLVKYAFGVNHHYIGWDETKSTICQLNVSFWLADLSDRITINAFIPMSHLDTMVALLQWCSNIADDLAGEVNKGAWWEIASTRWRVHEAQLENESWYQDRCESRRVWSISVFTTRSNLMNVRVLEIEKPIASLTSDHFKLQIGVIS